MKALVYFSDTSILPYFMVTVLTKVYIKRFATSANCCILESYGIINYNFKRTLNFFIFANKSNPNTYKR